MKLVPDKLGGNNKQYAVLGGLVLVLIVVYFLNRTPSSPAPVTPPRPVAVPDPAVPKMPSATRRAANRNAASRGEDFRPSLKLPEGMDVSKIDPTIRLDLLAKVRNVNMESGPRGSVFQFGKEPPPPTPKVPPIQVSNTVNPAAPPPVEAPKGPPPTPQAPPIPLKFFGYSSPRGGAKRAFFLDGEDIDVVHENDVIKNRYKVIRIGINSVVVEDINFKSQQTLPLVEELAG